MKTKVIMDGNEACAHVAYYFSEVCGIYPITPASPMATLCDEWSSEGRKNLFNDIVSMKQMQSEAGAAALIHGSLQGGSLSTTFTASQGLLLMIPEMYKIAGELLPGVIHVAARSLSTHALSIFGDHQDVYATRSTGFAFLSSSNVQDAYYMAIVAHLSAIEGSIPFLHFFDGFRTSHELNKIEILDDLSNFVDKESIKKFKDRAINLGKNETRGTSQTEDIYFQNTEARNTYYNKLPDIVMNKMNQINKVAGTDYRPFEYYGGENATKIIIAMGSVTDTIKSVIDSLGDDYGLINVRLYRPFSVKHLLNILPKSVNRIAVLDRTKEAGSNGEPLYLDIVGALKDKNIEIIGGRYGLSSKDVSPGDIKIIYDELNKFEMKNNFTIGINDNVTNTSLEKSDFNLENDYKEVRVYGFGSDGMVSGCKDVLKILGSHEDKYIQDYAIYDSKKSAGVTISEMRISQNQINAPYYLTKPNLVAVSKEDYVLKYNILDGICDGGILLLNSKLTDEELNENIPNNIKEIIKTKNIKFYITDANTLAEKYGLGNKVNTIISTILLQMLNGTFEDLEKYKEMVKKTYASKSEKIIESNILAIEESMDYLRKINNKILTSTTEDTKTCSNTRECMIKRMGDKLPVSEFCDNADGTFCGGTSSSDRNKIGSKVPVWIKENCIECNQCSFVCPHAVIRSFSMDETDRKKYRILNSEVINSLGEKEKDFYIGVNEENCTACGLCIEACPGKGGKKALEFGEPNEYRNEKTIELFKFDNQVNFNEYTVKGLGFKKPGFEYPGACAGCGETGYLRILTQLYKDQIVIANATGCSSIYGASLPKTPYNIPWISSLFEDNAEFGLGIHESYKQTRNRIKNIMYDTKDNVETHIKAIYKTWIDNMEDFEITSEVKEKLINENIPDELKELIDYIPSRKLWIVGGDGWAYDIGYGGLDHVLYTGENVNILILDSEVYSNTGGQTSKSTRQGAIAEFSNNGKKTNKKDMFKAIMNIPNVYVASISMKANNMQTLKAFKEANEHNGPSVIIAYSPCIAQGIKGGLSSSLEEEKLLVDSGYNILMRYNPTVNKIKIDSKDPEFDLYNEIFKRELRYKNLNKIDKENAEKLLEKNLDAAKKRYNYYKKLESVEE